VEADDLPFAHVRQDGKTAPKNEKDVRVGETGMLARDHARWALAIVLSMTILIAPAVWNHFPLLQYDTGGYLARWYEGYLVPSRSTVFGLYLHFGEDSSFWINLGIQALATMWILQLTLRVFGMVRPWRLAGLSVALILTTALPWLASTLLTDIFAGLSVMSLYILVLHGDRISGVEKASLFGLTAFAAATTGSEIGRK